MAVPLARRVASVLLALGVLLVFAGFTAAMGFTAWGILASVAAVAALVFAGATWFGSSAPRPSASPLLVFDRDRRIVTGEAAGQPLISVFPHILQPEIDRHCAAALSGTGGRFRCLQNGQMVIYDVLPVRTHDGVVAYGILLSTDAQPANMAAGV
jgi:hypothetical protein